MSILIKLSIYIAVSVLAFGCQSKVPDAMNKLTMKPATTYLYLLRDTPFFIGLSDQQLKFVIDNSMEYEVEKGGVISVCSEGSRRRKKLLDPIGWEMGVKLSRYNLSK